MLLTVSPTHTLRTRLRPLYIAAGLSMVSFWVPIEKLFLSGIGFDAAAIGLMAAVYAAVVPILEIPSGILADRWSRRGVLIVGSVALSASSFIGGLSNNVPTYLIAAVLLGVFFAMYSGTVDAMVYDTVLEETGGSEEYEKRIGRVRGIESAALVASALLAGWLAELTSPRLMYFLTVPFVAASIVFYLRFTEPKLHKASETGSLRGDLADTFRTVRGGALLPIVALAIMAAMVESVIVEFGPLWLVALAAPTVLFGPYWAGLMSTFGFGGMLAGRLNLNRTAVMTLVAGAMVVAGVVLTMSHNVLVVTVAQMVLVLLVTVVAIHVSKLVHDAVPSSIRTGVASGISALSWLVFLPFALVFGVITKYHGVHAAGWMIAGAAAIAGLLLIAVGRRRA